MRDTSPFNFSSASIGRLETGSGMTPLVDATAIFFEEFTLENGASLTRHVAREKRRKDEDLDSVVESGFIRTTYMYDAMKENRTSDPKFCWYVLMTRVYRSITDFGALLCKRRQARGCNGVFRPLFGRTSRGT